MNPSYRPARPYLMKTLALTVEETRLSTVANGFQELSDAQRCIASNGYCWWYVGERMQSFEKILIRTEKGDSSVFDGYLETSGLLLGSQISNEDFIIHRPRGNNWDIEKKPNSKFFKVVNVFIHNIPISSVINANTGKQLTIYQLRSTTHLLTNF
jgi:hypothetical protein